MCVCVCVCVYVCVHTATFVNIYKVSFNSVL